ncbi:dTDP-4-amino-4,6-dideoxygalactose transaminase [Thermodesulfobacteriota bacterium]
MYTIPFNRPFLSGNEFEYINDAIRRGHISGDGYYTKQVSAILEQMTGGRKTLLTTSCTHALEMTALLLDLKAGDEFIVPSYTFVSTINAFLLRGAKPVFAEIREDTLNIDENHIEDLITENTRVIIPVHYGGIGAEMVQIMETANTNGLHVIEDAAQAIGSSYQGKSLGTWGTFGTLSFHETKNIQCGEGGALIINDESYIEKAEIIREKGTNRNKFFRGEVDKYTWVGMGSSYLMSDLLAAFLMAQLEKFDQINAMRKRIYNYYREGLADLEKNGRIRLPAIPEQCEPNYHLFYIIFREEEIRDRVMNDLKENGILSVFHYVPLHSSPMGKRYGYRKGDLPVTEKISRCLLRLPFFNEITYEQQDRVIDLLLKSLSS